MKTLALTILALLILTGCTAYQTAIEPADSNDLGTVIVISDYRFNPQITTVHEGDRVTWRNLDSDAHSLMYDGVESDPLSRGETFSITAQSPGRYTYNSGNHPFIEGTLIVSE